jgi:predicted PurR-regulated permease PerM
MSNQRLIRITLFLASLCALVYLGDFGAKVFSEFYHLISLLALAWLIAFVLKPAAQWLDRGPIPQSVIGQVSRRWGERPANVLRAVRIPYNLAAMLLYLLMLFGLVAITLLVVPRLINQLVLLSQQLPDYIEQFPGWWEEMQDKIVERYGVDRAVLADLVPMEKFARQATDALPDVILNTVQVVQGIVSGIANLLLVLILSLYLMLDSQRLSNQIYRIVPLRYQDELDFVNRTIVRSFGNFLRGKVIQGVIHTVFVGIVMVLLGLRYTLIVAPFTGLMMFIPQLGAPIAMLAPALASVIQGSEATLPLLLIMVVFQQALIRFIMPSLTSEWIGMPSLLVMLSVLVGAKLFGVWGFFFSTPVAAAIYIITITALERVKQALDAQDEQRRADLSASVAEPSSAAPATSSTPAPPGTTAS